MRIQVITVQHPPEPGADNHGAFRRLRLFMQALAALGGRIEIAHLSPPETAAPGPPPDQAEARARAYWGFPVTPLAVPRATRLENNFNHYAAGILRVHDQPRIFPFAGPTQAAAIGALLDRAPDLVFVHRLPAMCAVLRSGRRPARMFFDLDDVEHLVRLREATQAPLRPGRLVYGLHAPALALAEWRGTWRARRSFVCSELDARRLRRLGMPRVTAIPNALPMPETLPQAAAPTILFLGLCTYRPNQEAAERLARRILPLVHRAIPQARLLLAGAGSDTLPSRAGNPEGVDYLGYVDDLATLYAGARIVCCPITLGGGTRVKLVEAAGYARPIVSTRLGAEGLNFVDGRDILLRETDEQIAAACIALLRDDARCAALAAAARARALELYDGERVQRRIEEIFRTA